MPSFVLVALAHLLFLLFFPFSGQIGACLRWLGIGGAGCALSTFAEMACLCLLLVLLGVALALVRLMLKRANVWDAWAMVVALPWLVMLAMGLRG